MANKKTELVEMIAAKCGITKKLAKNYVDGVITGIKEIILSGESLHISGFANFDVIDIPERKKVNGFTGKEMVVPAHKAVKVKISKDIKDALK